MSDTPLTTYEQRLQEGLEEAKAKGATAGRIFFQRGTFVRCVFEAGRLKTSSTKEHSGYNIEVLAGGRRGVAGGNQLEDMSELIERAVGLAKVGSVAHFEAYPAPTPVTPLDLYATSTAELAVEKLVDTCGGMVEKLKAYDDELFIDSNGSRATEEGVLVTTGGVAHSYRQTHWGLGIGAQRTRGTDILFVGEGRQWRELNEYFDPAYLAERTLRDLRRAERNAAPPSGATTVMLPPEALSMLVWGVAMGVNGRNVAKGDSPLKGRLGEKVFGDNVTLADDPHRPYSPGSESVDAGGVSTRPMTIVKDGRVEAFLYDLDSAGLAGAEPTGHNGCRPYNAEVAPGAEPHEALMAGITDGLLVKYVIGFGQGNLMNGDFSCNVGLGFRIEGGEITGRVKDTMIAGNLYELLNRVTFSADRDPLLNMPYAVFDGVGVSSK